MREKSAQAQAELMRLLRLAKSSDIPPETLLQEMQQMEKEQKRVVSVVAELEARIEATTAQQAWAADERDQIAGIGTSWRRTITLAAARRQFDGDFGESMYSPTVFPSRNWAMMP